MPIVPTYPGVYIEELRSGVRTITGVATSITAFIGRALRGPAGGPSGAPVADVEDLRRPVRIQSFADFERIFGGLWVESTMSYAVQQYFANGGTDALIVRVHNAATAATATRDTNFGLVAASEGKWGASLKFRIDHDTRPAEGGEDAAKMFNIWVRDGITGTVERFVNLSVDALHPRYVKNVLQRQSSLVRIDGNVPAVRPNAHGTLDPTKSWFEDANAHSAFNASVDGDPITSDQITGAGLEGHKHGLWRLEYADLFNLLCIPPLARETDIPPATWKAAIKYCKDRRAMLIVDSNWDWHKAADALNGVGGLVDRTENGAVFFPRIVSPDPLRENRLSAFAPCGAIAGVFARTDTERGVWKAPAGIDATLMNVADLTVNLTDGENGQLNPLGINCLRSFPIVGRVIWGARTLKGADQLADQWKYIPVRRLALFIEESLYRGTQWVVFEPNDEPLWAQIRLNIGAFMHDLFRQGAFQGQTPREAYFVKCSHETTTQTDIDKGIVNIIVGFAPLNPAEFVILKIQQIRDRVEA